MINLRLHNVWSPRGGGTSRWLQAAVLVVASVASVATPALTPAAVAAPALAWSACPPPEDGSPDYGQECATLQVPRDYQQPGGPKIDVAVSRVHAANPALRRGALLMNFGGPGAPGVDGPRLFSAVLPQDVLDRYDLVGFDPRGVGQSTPVSCGLTEEQAEQVLIPLQQSGGFDATAALMHQAADACAQTSGALMPYITTANTARDMDQIRQALGETKISYVGFSYGTYLGAVYASLYPTRTDRFIIDSSVNPQAVWRGQFRSWGQGGDDRFPDFAQFAVANDATYHLGNTEARVKQKFFQLVDKLNQQPIEYGGFTVNGPLFRELTFGGLYFDASFPDTADLWQTADTAGAAGAAAAVKPSARPQAPAGLAAVPEDNSEALALGVLCDDVAWPKLPAQYRLGLLSDTLQHPMFGPLGSNIWPCAYWHNAPKEPPVTISSSGPRNILMLQNRRDPATPYSGALQMHAALGQRSQMVSVDMGGHTSYVLTDNACSNATANNYLVTGVLPAADTACPAGGVVPLTAQATTAAHQHALQVLRQRMQL